MRAYSGSRQLLNYLYSTGAEVYFVSSRYEHLQLEPTLQRLKLSGLFLNPQQTQVLLRKKGETSIDFKERAFKSIKARENSGRKTVLVAENEPENMNLMTRIFPDAVPVFLVRAQIVSIPLNPHPKMLVLKHYSSNSP